MGLGIRNIFRLPVFADEDKERAANVLGTTMLVILAVALVRTALAFAAEKEFLGVILRQDMIMIVMFTGIFFLMRVKRVRTSCIVFTVYQWCVIALITFQYGGVRLSAFSFFIFVITGVRLTLKSILVSY